jgi:hypothetical protein
MATIYKVEIVSHWVNYNEETLKKILEKSLLEKSLLQNGYGKGNEFTIKVKRK